MSAICFREGTHSSPTRHRLLLTHGELTRARLLRVLVRRSEADRSTRSGDLCSFSLQAWQLQRLRCPHAVDGAFRSLQGTSGEPRDFGAAGTACAVAAGHAAAAVATGLDRAWSLSGRTACRCSMLHRDCVRALYGVCSSNMAADRWPTSIPCQGTSLVQRRPVCCALVSHGAAACVK